MTDTKGTINARKLGNTGITEDLLTKIADKKGGHVLAVVELKADSITEKVDGDDRHVTFLIDTIEPVVDGKLNGTIVDHVRDIQAALHRNRMLDQNGPQLPIDGDSSEPTVEQVKAAGEALVEHDDDGPKLWDGDSEPDDEDQADEEPEPENPAYEPHEYVDTAHATCGFYDCKQPAGAAIHTPPNDREPTAA